MTPLQREINRSAASLLDRADGLRVRAWGSNGGANATALDALEWVAALRDELTALETLIVRHAREQGASWADIADPLGITKQAAHQHWGPPAAAS